jgi:UPF0148 protein
MNVDNADELMAEYLLKGGKMLAKACKTCNSPLFEYKGETLCVVCSRHEATEGEAEKKAIKPVLQQESGAGSPAGAPGHEPLADELERTLISLCRRIRDESHAGECLILMQTVREGAEALARLNHR